MDLDSSCRLALRKRLHLAGPGGASRPTHTSTLAGAAVFRLVTGGGAGGFAVTDNPVYRARSKGTIELQILTWFIGQGHKPLDKRGTTGWIDN